MDSKVFICASATELKTWMEYLELRRYMSTEQPLSPTHCALSYLVITLYYFPELNMKCYISTLIYWTPCVSAAVTLWWALEKRGAENIPTKSSDMAVGGFSNPAHGTARICVPCAHHQYTKTGKWAPSGGISKIPLLQELTTRGYTVLDNLYGLVL